MTMELSPQRDPVAGPEKCPLVKVLWIDSGMALGDTWVTKDEIIERTEGISSMTAVTVGWLIHQDDYIYVIAQTYDQHNEKFINAQIIATSAVKAWTEIG